MHDAQPLFAAVTPILPTPSEPGSFCADFDAAVDTTAIRRFLKQHRVASVVAAKHVVTPVVAHEGQESIRIDCENLVEYRKNPVNAQNLPTCSIPPYAPPEPMVCHRSACMQVDTAIKPDFVPDLGEGCTPRCLPHDTIEVQC